MAGARHGGAEAFFTRLVVALQRAGVEQHVVMRRNLDRYTRMRWAGLMPSQRRFGGPIDILTPRQIRAEIRRFRPGVVLSWMNRAAAMCPRGTGQFTHCARLGGYYNLKYYRTCNHLIGNTRGIVDYLQGAGWPADRVHYLPNFVDAAKRPALSRQAHDTPDGVPLLLALGRLHENKAFDVLLDAMARLPGIYLWLAGDGPLGQDLRAQAARLGLDDRVRFLGWQTDTAPLYAAADAVVCPSRIEPLGNVVIEAWAQRRPIVASRAAGPAELIAADATGVLAPVDDAGALADAIARVFDDRDLRRRLVEQGQARYQAEFTEAAVVARYIAFFDKVAP